MATSKAKKARLKQEREGRRNPELNRSPFTFADLRTRKTKTKKVYYIALSTRIIPPLMEKMILFYLYNCCLTRLS
ncbi:hypothetical protein [Halalkalibacter alkalisediminis]|uniref:Uncharacterized protein n=1 Tax=Halalkalibacter alkalisediminis TaxID=935616 RepID=A0ABV6NH57_9BACI